MADGLCDVCNGIEKVRKYHISYGTVSRDILLCGTHSQPIRDIVAATRTVNFTNADIVKDPKPIVSAGELRALRRKSSK